MATKPKALGSSIPTDPRLLGLGWLPDLTRLKRLRFYYSFVLSSLYHAIGQRSVSGREEGNAKHFGLTGMSNDEMTR